MVSAKTELAVLALTPGGKAQARRLAALMACDCYTSEKLLEEGFQGFAGSMEQCVARLFPQYQALLFICASGICVRMIAPLIRDKLADPAVLVMDEQARHVISLLSGHVGGANRLAQEVAAWLGATAVITTATDVNDLAAFDTLAQSLGVELGAVREQIKFINQLLVSGEKVGLYLDRVRPSDIRGFQLLASVPQQADDLAALVLVSARTDITPQGYRPWGSESDLPPVLAKTNSHSWQCPLVQIVPRNLVVGMGCRLNTDGELIYRSLMQHLEDHHLDVRAIGKIGSVEIKRNEPGLLQLAERLGVPFEVFSLEALGAQEHRFPCSEFVRKTIGIGCVSQPAAWLMSDGNIIGETLKQNGITITFGVNECCI